MAVKNLASGAVAPISDEEGIIGIDDLRRNGSSKIAANPAMKRIDKST